LKRQEAGEDIFRKLEEVHPSVVDELVVQAFRERDALRVAGINCNTTKPSKSLVAAAKQHIQKQQKKGRNNSTTTAKISRSSNRTKTAKISVTPPSSNSESTGPESVIAAAALCQLSSTSGLWSNV
jgi:hypothetical protein